MSEKIVLGYHGNIRIRKREVQILGETSFGKLPGTGIERGCSKQNAKPAKQSASRLTRSGSRISDVSENRPPSIECGTNENHNE